MPAQSVAIVGLGPKGLYCLERLCAEYAAHPLDEPLTIHVFDRTARFGASPIYDPAQPDHILVNISVGEIDLWNVDDPPPAAGRGPNFLHWYRDAYGSELTGEEYLPRAAVGRYLVECFERIVDNVPRGVSIVRHTDEVADIEPAPDGYRIGEVHAHKILLATGHSRNAPTAIESEWATFADRHERVTFIPFVYPVVETMRAIPAGARVAMLGIGLTFIDAVLELTEARGGRFVDGTYVRSGNEPSVIYPFSRTGLPMTPKAVDLPPHPRVLRFVTRDALQRMRRENGPLDFERDILPLFEREMDGLDWRAYVDPPRDASFDVAAYMEGEIARARRGHANDPLKAAIDCWYEVRKTIGEILPFGGLTPESHRVLIEEYYPRFKRVVFGPPVINIEKLLALTRAGVLDFSVSRSPRVTMNDACFEIATARAEVLVDARYPRTDVARDASPLYRNLGRRGMIRPFRNRGYAPGAIDMTEESRFVIDAEGNVNEDIAVIGIPTEGNLVGNLTIGRDRYAGVWARQVMGQLRSLQRPVVHVE